MGIIGEFLKRRRRDNAKADSERGLTNEWRVWKVLQRPSRPWWITNVRMSTVAEDHRGIDVVVETSDYGDLYLQVKSSLRGAKEFRSKSRSVRVDIEVVVVARTDDANTLYGKTLGALILLRERLDAMSSGLVG